MTSSTAQRPTERVIPLHRRGLTGAQATRNTLFHIVSIALSILFLFPLVWALLNSFRGGNATSAGYSLIPDTWTLQHYIDVAKYGSGIGVYFLNSVVLSVLVVAGTLIVSILGGYGFARFEFRGKRVLFLATIAILMVPYATILLPLYIVLGALGLQNSLFGLSLVLIMFQLPFATYMMRNSFESIPRELEEAALVDGCSAFGALRRVSIRIVTPGLVTVGLFAFIGAWNEFLAPLIFLNSGDSYTLPVMLVNIRSAAYGTVDFGALQAGVVVATVPCLVLYLLLQRFYVSGLVNGALRG
jgi:multiple sugar transport system permease protein